MAVDPPYFKPGSIYGENSEFKTDNLQFTLLSGRGFGIQAINFAKADMNFKVTMIPLKDDVKVSSDEYYPKEMIAKTNKLNK